MVIGQGAPLRNFEKSVSKVVSACGPVGMSIAETFSNADKFSPDDFFKQFFNWPYIFFSNPLFVRTPKL